MYPIGVDPNDPDTHRLAATGRGTAACGTAALACHLLADPSILPELKLPRLANSNWRKWIYRFRLPGLVIVELPPRFGDQLERDINNRNSPLIKKREMDRNTLKIEKISKSTWTLKAKR